MLAVAARHEIAKRDAEIKRLQAKLQEAASCLDRGAYDLRDGGYLRSATVLEECAADIRTTAAAA
jgi:hypothetical protein